MEEHDTVALTVALPKHGLERGDLGAIVQVDESGAAFEVEFVTLRGETVAVASLLSGQIRAVGRREIAHVRSFAQPA